MYDVMIIYFCNDEKYLIKMLKKKKTCHEANSHKISTIDLKSSRFSLL